MEPIRILHVIGSLNNGGSQSMIMSLYENIDKSKVQFDFVVFQPNELFYEKKIKEFGGKIYTLPNFTAKTAFSFFNSWKNFFIEHPEYEIIHGHVRSTASIYLRIAKKFGLITIAHSHSTSNGKGFLAMIKKTLQYPIRYEANYLFACSKKAGEWLYGKAAIKKNNFYILKNAINVENYIYNFKKRNETRKNFNINDKLVIGHVGRMTMAKNHDFIIDIFKEICKIDSQAVLILVGDGERREIIEERIKGSGIHNNVIFTGVRSDIDNILQGMDIFLFPSFYEGLGISVIEAQAAGLKCIVSDTVPIDTKISSDVEYVSLQRPAKYWAEKIIKINNNYTRKNNKDVLKKFGYDAKETAKWLQKFYQEII